MLYSEKKNHKLSRSLHKIHAISMVHGVEKPEFSDFIPRMITLLQPFVSKGLYFIENLKKSTKSRTITFRGLGGRVV